MNSAINCPKILIYCVLFFHTQDQAQQNTQEKGNNKKWEAATSLPFSSGDEN